VEGLRDYGGVPRFWQLLKCCQSLICYGRFGRFMPVTPGGSRGIDAPTSVVGFHTTHWTVVLAARDKNGVGAQEALSALCSTYWYPIYAFVRRHGSTPHEAEDLTQEFFYRFLERHSLGSVKPTAGKFRSFLLACLKNFLSNERERTGAQRRGGGQVLMSLDTADAESRYLLEPAHNVTPEAMFERRWALAVLAQAMTELRKEFAAANRQDELEDFAGFLPGGHATRPRAELAAKRSVSAGAIDVAIHRLRQRFGALVRDQVAQTVSTDTEVEEELRHLISVLGS